MCHFVHIHPEAERFKQALGRRDDIRKGLRADNRSRQSVCDSEQQMAATLVRKCYAVLAQPCGVEVRAGGTGRDSVERSSEPAKCLAEADCRSDLRFGCENAREIHACGGRVMHPHRVVRKTRLTNNVRGEQP
jgi:hypothetical protein